MKRFKLESGHIIKVDDQDAYLLRSQVWRVQTTSKGGQLVQARYRRWGVALMLSHLIMDAPDGSRVRHLDSDQLNFQRANLQVVTRDEFYRRLGIEHRLLATLLHA